MRTEKERDIDILHDYLERKCGNKNTIFYGHIGLCLISKNFGWPTWKTKGMVSALVSQYPEKFQKMKGGIIYIP